MTSGWPAVGRTFKTLSEYDTAFMIIWRNRYRLLHLKKQYAIVNIQMASPVYRVGSEDSRQGVRFVIKILCFIYKDFINILSNISLDIFTSRCYNNLMNLYITRI